MLLGLLTTGMAAGAAVAVAWLLAGGSVLGAIGLYGLVGTTFVLGAAFLAPLLPEHKPRAREEALPSPE